MQTLYNIFIFLAKIFIPIAGLVNPKMRLFYNGRKETFSKLQNTIAADDKTIWIHCASLGEFEQGIPIIEKINSQYPDYKIVISFFSPSGYEIQKNYKYADVVVYLPIDSKTNALQFIKLVHPSLAIFIKYEFWPNILQQLKQKNIKTILVSGIFRKNQVFFRKNRAWFRNSLSTFSHFFVQDEDSVHLLKNIGFSNVSKSGDTRFDRVHEIVNQKKDLAIIANFSYKHHILVAGSTWNKDEILLTEYINKYAEDNERFIIAPHNIKQNDIEKLINKIQKKTVLYSKANKHNIIDNQVLIIDSIGILTSIYKYADVAYVGGGFGTGIHNILEPATYGIPIIIGPNYQKFKEANDLILSKACFEINNIESLTKQLSTFHENLEITKTSGAIALDYIHKNIGATKKIMEYIAKVL
jgi:3-deoxy-D-manno-octulosonic-acid transferase